MDSLLQLAESVVHGAEIDGMIITEQKGRLLYCASSLRQIFIAWIIPLTIDDSDSGLSTIFELFDDRRAVNEIDDFAG
jgi:hypothetical protein